MDADFSQMPDTTQPETPAPGSTISDASQRDLLCFPWSDRGMAEACLARWPETFIHTPEDGWFAWDGRAWDARSAESYVHAGMVMAMEAREAQAEARYEADKATIEALPDEAD